MGNTLGGKKTTKVMKIDGETFKLKTPIKASEVLKNHPGLVLLDSEAVKHYGVRAKALEEHKDLQPKRLYFLVELPKERVLSRRVQSGIHMSAKERLESLALTRRSVSDLTLMKQSNMGKQKGLQENSNGGVRLKLRLPKAEVEKLMKGSKDEAEAAERIMDLCMVNGKRDSKHEIEEIDENMMLINQIIHWKSGRSRVAENTKACEKRVSFMTISEGGGQVPVAS